MLLASALGFASALLFGARIDTAPSSVRSDPPLESSPQPKLDDWAPAIVQQFRGGASNNDIRAWPHLLRWTQSLPGAVRGALLDHDAFFLATESRSGVAAVSPATGAPIWLASAPSWVHGDPVAYQDNVIVTYGHFPIDGPPGGVIAFDKATGRTRWRLALGASAMSAPALRGDTVFVVGGDGCALAISAASGATRWRRCFGSPFAMSSPRLSGDAIFAGADDGSLYRWSTATGAALWRFRDTIIQHVGDVPVAVDDSLLFTTGVRFVQGRTSLGELPLSRIIATSMALLREGRIRDALGLRFDEQFAIAVRRDDGSEKWRTPLGTSSHITRNLSGTPVLAGGALFLSSPLTRTAFRLDPASGAVVWRQPLGAVSRGALIVVNDRVWIAAEDSTVRVLDARSGDPVGACRLDSSGTPFAPVVIGGSLLLAGRSGTVMLVPFAEMEGRLRGSRAVACDGGAGSR
jgi:outer membrane protein assembly factor BamB